MKIIKKDLMVVTFLLVSSIIGLLTACGNPPLILPEGNGATIQQATTPSDLGQATATVEKSLTPSSVSSIRVVKKTPLPLDDTLSAAETKPSEFVIRDWTKEEGLILEAFISGDNKEVLLAASPNGQMRQLTDWKPLTAQSNEAQTAIEELKGINSRINITSISPNGQWVAGGIIDEPVLLVKNVNSDQPPIPLLTDTSWPSFAQFMAWSPSSQQLAYAVGSGPYQIRISDPADISNTIIVKLWDAQPLKITWSPDERFVAFLVPEEPQHPSDVYVVGVDGKHLTNITNDNLWISSVAWSPDSRTLAYSDHSQVWLVEIAVTK